MKKEQSLLGVTSQSLNQDYVREQTCVEDLFDLPALWLILGKYSTGIPFQML